MTAIPWVASIPTHWQVAPFFTVFRESKTSNTGMVESNLLSLSYGRIVRKNIDADEGLLPESFETYQIIEPDTIVFRLTDLQNDQRSLRTGRAMERGIITSAYGAAQPTGLNARYADYLMRSYDTTKVFYSFGGGVRQSLKLKDIARMPVLVPPMDEQRAIADYLDRETTQIDTLIAKQEQLIATLRERRSATVSHTLSAINADEKQVPLQYLGAIPMTNGLGLPGSHYDPTWPRYIRTTDIADSWSLRQDTFASQPPEVAANAMLEPGDILMTAAGATIGKSTLFSGDYPACYAGFLVRFRPRPDVSGHFIIYWMQSADYWSQINAGAVRSTIDNFSAGKYRKLRAPNIPLDEQHRTTSELDATISRIDSLITKAEQFVALAKERRSALITATTTGQFDTREG